MRLPLGEKAICWLDDSCIIAAESYMPFPKGEMVFLEAWACEDVLDEIAELKKEDPDFGKEGLSWDHLTSVSL